MKNIIFLTFIVFGFISCTNRGQINEETVADNSLIENEDTAIIEGQALEVADESFPVITLDKEVHEFGVVNEGEKVKHVFGFTNTGNAPLIISNVSASCGCTTPEYSNHPINPGDKGSVTVVFDSKNQVGMQQKIITVLSNADPSRINLQLIGEVK
jgi:hypothetical protein